MTMKNTYPLPLIPDILNKLSEAKAKYFTKLYILEGIKHTIEILNDHQNPIYFQTSQNLNYWKTQWSLFSSCFYFSLVHRSG